MAWYVHKEFAVAAVALGSMDMLCNWKLDMLKRTASSDLYQLFRDCSLAVLNSGGLIRQQQRAAVALKISVLTCCAAEGAA